ncbi:hypothetical protein LSAT2_002015 [Lamellibrachia satsuma]|nr:hypothetical protein LSAT2_002015 [Lamellibrachia satsuma]
MYGFATLVVGIVFYLNPSLVSFVNDQSEVKWPVWDNVTLNYTRSFALTMMVTGLFTFIVAVVGFMGCRRRDPRSMKFFFIFIMFDLVTIFVLSTWTLVKRKEHQTEINLKINTAVNVYKTSGTARYFIDKVQEAYKCCGAQTIVDAGLDDRYCSFLAQTKSCAVEIYNATTKAAFIYSIISIVVTTITTTSAYILYKAFKIITLEMAK